MGNQLTSKKQESASVKQEESVTGVRIPETQNDLDTELQNLIKNNPENEFWLCTVLLNDAHGKVSGLAINNNTGNLYFTSNGIHLYKMNGYQQNKPTELLRGESFGSIVWDGQHTMYVGYREREYECILAWNTDNEQISSSPKILTQTDVAQRFVAGDFKSAKNSSKFHNLQGITVDRKTGTIYASDYHLIHKIPSVPDQPTEILAGKTAGIHLSGAHKDGKAIGEAKFDRPCGLAFRNGALYVADCGNQCIRKIKDNEVSTIGTPSPAWVPSDFVGSYDGPIDQANFLNPRELCFDYNGDLLVMCDRRIRRIDFRRQMVSTILLYPLLEQTLSSICLDDKGNMFIGTSSRIYRVERVTWITWRKYKRYLWIGHLKEKPTDCLLPTLPKDLIKEIANYL